METLIKIKSAFFQIKNEHFGFEDHCQFLDKYAISKQNIYRNEFPSMPELKFLYTYTS